MRALVSNYTPMIYMGVIIFPYPTGDAGLHHLL